MHSLQHPPLHTREAWVIKLLKLIGGAALGITVLTLVAENAENRCTIGDSVKDASQDAQPADERQV